MFADGLMIVLGDGEGCGMAEIPGRVGKPALRAFAAAGFSTVEQFAQVSAVEVAALHGLGPKAVIVMRESLAELGLTFADEPGVQPS
ncbi:hypothetical protein SAMN05192558_11456 [Actinokineospora alba]|uniref:Helix-hairpin-helix domain-containing protein n=1 Tax=Actinokineospora alba TaxID=504798 RepID=A0A1H0VIL8_9PSEU|nr:hypothetical protein [Actinokineospora alba]TDP67703.1 hypothetical protein C8E96_3253 [Actinokineospora alba]SDJ27909.1 hypothetical protein SAMN05421871_11256 [Actinokineospora alba]SDP78161.1 hypothetical protein SAMN05192558_11456 [Actinokineospora alba]